MKPENWNILVGAQPLNTCTEWWREAAIYVQQGGACQTKLRRKHIRAQYDIISRIQIAIFLCRGTLLFFIALVARNLIPAAFHPNNTYHPLFSPVTTAKLSWELELILACDFLQNTDMMWHVNLGVYWCCFKETLPANAPLFVGNIMRLQFLTCNILQHHYNIIMFVAFEALSAWRNCSGSSAIQTLCWAENIQYTILQMTRATWPPCIFATCVRLLHSTVGLRVVLLMIILQIFMANDTIYHVTRLCSTLPPLSLPRLLGIMPGFRLPGRTPSDKREFSFQAWDIGYVPLVSANHLPHLRPLHGPRHNPAEESMYECTWKVMLTPLPLQKVITFKSKTAQIAFKCLEEQPYYVPCVKQKQAMDAHRSSARKGSDVANHAKNYDMEGFL